jgi:hypothetical protein
VKGRILAIWAQKSPELCHRFYTVWVSFNVIFGQN